MEMSLQCQWIEQKTDCRIQELDQIKWYKKHQWCWAKQQTSEVSAIIIMCCFYCFIFIVFNIDWVLQAFCCKLFNISYIIAFIKTSSYLWALDVMKPHRITMYTVPHLISSCFPTSSQLFFFLPPQDSICCSATLIQRLEHPPSVEVEMERSIRF